MNLCSITKQIKRQDISINQQQQQKKKIKLGKAFFLKQVQY